MPLFYVCYSNSDGHDLDAFIQADDAPSAAKMWREHWVGIGVLNDQFVGDFVPGATSISSDHARVFTLVPEPGSTGVLGWGDPTNAGAVKIEGYLLA